MPRRKQRTRAHEGFELLLKGDMPIPVLYDFMQEGYDYEEIKQKLAEVAAERLAKHDAVKYKKLLSRDCRLAITACLRAIRGTKTMKGCLTHKARNMADAAYYRANRWATSRTANENLQVTYEESTGRYVTFLTKYVDDVISFREEVTKLMYYLQKLLNHERDIRVYGES